MVFIPSKIIYLKFNFEVQDYYCLFWKQRKQFFTSHNSGNLKADTQQYLNMKSNELVTLRKICYFQFSDWVLRSNFCCNGGLKKTAPQLTPLRGSHIHRGSYRRERTLRFSWSMN